MEWYYRVASLLYEVGLIKNPLFFEHVSPFGV